MTPSTTATMATTVEVRGARAAIGVLAITLLLGGGSCGGEPDDLAAHWGREIEVGEGIVLFQPQGDVAELPEYFTWRTATAASYAVAILDADGEPVWMRQSLPAPSVAVDAALRAAIRPGQSYGWQVLAVEGSGKVVDGSEVGTFRLIAGGGPDDAASP